MIWPLSKFGWPDRPTEDGLPKGWHWSSGGNPQIVYRGTRVTIFESDGGWKFCLADDAKEDDDPHFSEAYETQDAAMYEAFALMDFEETMYRPLREIRRDARRARETDFWKDAVSTASSMAEQLRSALPRAIEDSRANITKLTPIVRKLEKQERWMERARDFYDEAGEKARSEEAETLRALYSSFSTMTNNKVTALRAARSRKRA